LLGHAVDCVEGEDGDVGGFDGLEGLDDGEKFHRRAGLAAAAHAGVVDQGVATAGGPPRGRTGTPVEFFSIVKALQAIEAANVAVLVLDAPDGVTEQDAHVAGYILERGRAVVIAVNKWDAASKEARERMKRELAWKLGFLGYADTQFI